MNTVISENDAWWESDPDALKSVSEHIIANGMFDDAYYEIQCKLNFGSADEAIEHYLTVGEALGYRPHPDFDPVYYMTLNADLRGCISSPLFHYTFIGKSESRIATKYEAVEKLTLISRAEGYKGGPLAANPERDQISPDEARLAQKYGFADLFPTFEPDLYLRYADVPDCGAAPLLHYLEVGKAQARVINLSLYNHRRHVIASALDAEYYLAQRGEPTHEDLLDDWIFYGSVSGLDPAKDFSPRYYAREYEDLRNAQVDMFEHFVAAGKAEGRKGYFDAAACFNTGRRAPRADRETIMLVVHEASATGAPILGLHILRALAEKYNLVCYMGRGGDLVEDFAEHCTTYIIGNHHHSDYIFEHLTARMALSAVVMNSIESSFFAKVAFEHNVATVALIHEFASYTMPKGRMSDLTERADIVVVPSAVIEQSLQDEIEFTRGSYAQNVIVRPQGYLGGGNTEADPQDLTREQIYSLLDVAPGTSPAIVLGAGYVQMRKGVDLFVQTAAEFRKRSSVDVRFVWVGSGYKPDTDISYSVWLRDMITRAGLDDIVYFVPHQSQIDTLLGMTDVFYLSSRLDPFPNVAIDALAANRPLVCYDKASGIADAIKDFDFYGRVVGHCDVAEAAEALVDLIESPNTTGNHNADIIARDFAFKDYVADIELYMQQAKEKVAARVIKEEKLKKISQFDPKFYEGNKRLTKEEGDLVRKLYLARAEKGIWSINPAPGFCETKYHLDNGSTAGSAFLDENVRLPLQTHKTFDLNKLTTPETPVNAPMAIHIHLHYSEIAAEFVALLNQCNVKADIFVSTTSPEVRITAEYALLKYKGGQAKVVQNENKGRDVLPFVEYFKDDFLSGKYDIIGHFHGKKSLAISAEFGDRWRSFLFNTLIGTSENVELIQSLFASDPKLGLVFAEDRHSVGWSKNKEHAHTLAKRLKPSPVVPEHPVFPLGTMFWSRAAALKSLWLSTDLLFDVPLEPLKYDGTILHAFERMLPSIVESNGYGWATIHHGGAGW
jgi:glycosyltransferase involved in cell wall biosynthesis